MTEEEILVEEVTKANKAWDAYKILIKSPEWKNYDSTKRLDVIRDMMGIIKIKWKAEDRLGDEYGYLYSDFQTLGR